jgi:hypothetical protein
MKETAVMEKATNGASQVQYRGPRLPGSKRKVRCPLCKGGCELCEEGYIDIKFASGSMYTAHCRDCGKNNGVRIVNRQLHLPNTIDPCIACGSDNTVWSYLRKVV